MPAQEKLSPTEQILAYLIGGGIGLAVVALFLYGLAVIDSDYALSFLLIGLALIVIGIGAWLFLLRPWEHFDDLKTPLYTGHDEHGEHEEAAAEMHTGPVALEEPRPDTAVATESAPAVEEKPAAPEPEKAPAAAPKPQPDAALEPAPDKAPAPEPVAAAEPEPQEEPAPEPEPEPAEEPGEPDDLTVIEGVGPKSAQALNDGGVMTFKQMAAMTPEALEDTVKSRKVRLVGSTTTWPMQAELAAEGDFTALEDLKSRIKGGYLHDDLTQIEGVGPKAQEALYDAGFRSFEDVAAASVDALKAVLEQADLKLLTPDTWPQQAELLAKGDSAALKDLQDRLEGGRE